MVAQSKRGVLVEVDTTLAAGYDKPLQELEKRIAALQNSARNIAVNVGTVGPAPGYRMGGTPPPGHAPAGSRRTGGRVVGFAGGAGYGSDWDQKQTDKAIADIQRFQRAADEAQRKDDERAKKAAERAKQAEEVEKRKRAADVLKHAQDNARKQGKLEDQVVKKEEKYQANQELERQKAIKETADAAKRAAAIQREAFARVTGSVNSSIDAVMKLTRGFVLLGSVNETDTQKIMRNLMEVQGVIDTVRGGIDTVRGIHGTISSMRAAGQAASAARGVGGVAGAVGTAGNVAAGAGGLLGAGRMAGMMGTAAAYAAPVAAFAAAAASVGVAGKVIYESLTGSAKNINSWSMKIATAEVRVAEMLHLRDDGTRKTERMQERREKNRKAQQEQDARNTAGVRERQSAARRKLDKFQETLDFQGQMTATGNPAFDLRAKNERLERMREAQEAERAAAEADKRQFIGPQGQGQGSNAAAAAAERVTEAEEKIEAIKRQQLLTTREIQKVAIDGMKEQLGLAEGANKSFKQRFGALNETTQQAVISAKAALKRGTATEYQVNLAREKGDAESVRLADKLYEKRADIALNTPEAIAAGMGRGEANRVENVREQLIVTRRNKENATGGESPKGGGANDLSRISTEANDNREAARDEVRQSLGTKMKMTVDNKVAVTVNADRDFEHNLQAALTDAINMFMLDQNRLIETIIQRAHQHVDRQVGNAVREIHTRGRIAAG